MQRKLKEQISKINNTMKSMIEVAIVGGEPAGSRCAYRLAENGIYQQYLTIRIHAKNHAEE